MPNFFLQYVTESAVCLLLFYLFYVVILQKETCFKFNRFYLLSALVVAVLLPLAALPAWPSPEPVVLVEQTVSFESLADYQLPMVEIAPPEEPFIYGPLLLLGYGLGLLFFMGRFGYQLLSLYRYARQEGTYFKLPNHAPVIQTNGKMPTFSFLGYVFFDNTQTLTPQETERILQHEQVHIDQKHSLDILLVSLLGIVFWFNPLLRLYKKALEQTHEFLADAEVVRHTDAREYTALLLKQVFQKAGFSMASYFFFNKSLTLTRIKMMKKLPNSRKTRKVLLVLPLFIGLVGIIMAMRPADIKDVEYAAQEDSRSGDAPAEFPRGEKAFRNYFDSKILLPEILFENAGNNNHIYMLMEYEYEIGVDGKARMGKILDLKTQPDGPEAREVVKNLYIQMLDKMPRWKPALKDGKPVAVVKKGGSSIDYHHAQLGYQKYLEYEFQKSKNTNEAAEFPGGRDAANNFVRDNFTFPKVAFDRLTGSDKAVQAVASLEVEIRENGSAVLSKVLEMEVSPNNPQVQEAVKAEFARLVSAMPAWSPALKNGKAVISKEIININTVSNNFIYNSTNERGTQQKTKVSSLSQQPARTSAKPASAEKEQIFIAVEKMPEFPGGQAEMFKYLSENFKLPAGAEATGTIVGSFVVSKEGKISNVQVLKKLSPSLDQEMIRVFNSMPDWKPGTQNGKKVAVKYTVPFRIVL